MNTHLSVNLNKVALVRNTRHLGIPSVTRAASLCLQAGAQGIVRRDPKVPDAIRRQTPLLTRHPNTPAAEDVRRLARDPRPPRFRQPNPHRPREVLLARLALLPCQRS